MACGQAFRADFVCALLEPFGVGLEAGQGREVSKDLGLSGWKHMQQCCLKD